MYPDKPHQFSRRDFLKVGLATAAPFSIPLASHLGKRNMKQSVIDGFNKRTELPITHEQLQAWGDNAPQEIAGKLLRHLQEMRDVAPDGLKAHATAIIKDAEMPPLTIDQDAIPAPKELESQASEWLESNKAAIDQARAAAAEHRKRLRQELINSTQIRSL